MAETLNYDNLLAGSFPRVTEQVTILSGETLVRGTVLGKVTASGKCVVVDSSAEDGSEDSYAILSEAVDASGGDVVSVAYLTGQFNENALVFGGSDDIDDHRAALRALSIFVSANVGA